MRLPSALLAALLSAAACAPALHAALEFTTTEITLDPALGEKQASTAFAFKNTGKAPVSITRVHSGCGCTVPEKPAEPVAPGAKGEIPVVYKADGRQGRQSQVVLVETSDGKTHELRLHVNLPVRVSFAPRLLLFRGGDAGPRGATVSYAPEAKAELLGVTVQTPDFEIVGEPKLEGHALKLPVRYVGDSAANARGSVRIRTRDAAGAEHVDVLYLRHTP